MIRKTTWIVLALFVGLMVVTIMLQRNNKINQVNSTPTSSAEYLFGQNDQEITAFYVEDQDGNVIALELNEDGNWIFVKPLSSSVDKIALESILNQTKTLRVLSRISPAPTDEAIGLDKPTFTIGLEFSDGIQSTLIIGNLTPTESGYYVGTDQNEVLVVNKLGLDAIGDSVLDPPIAEKVLRSPEPETTQEP